MFADLLRIKKYREDSAARAVKIAEQELKARQQAVRDAEQAVAKHHDFRIAEEERLFAAIKGSPVNLKKLDEMKAMVALLRDDEQRLEKAVVAAEKEVPPARKAVEAAEAVHREAVKATQKFTQFVEIQREAEKKAAGQREEAELEETAEAGFAAAQRAGE